MDTGGPEAKFGVPPSGAPELVERVAAVPGLELLGLHVHIGSQLLDLRRFRARCRGDRFARPLRRLRPRRRPRHRLSPRRSGTLAGGLPDATVAALHDHLDPGAHLIVEPGRSVVGRSGVTLYSVVTVKRGVLTHVAVNGGMADNLEPMLYGQQLAPTILDRERPPETCELVGHHCESGDVLVDSVALATPQVDDLLVMPVTGAYCYSLLNNYNGARRPPVMLVRDGDARLAVRREQISDLLARDML
jgi:diaminopimelate decarboxylase